ncbi:MAG: hypothetical protein IJY25_01680 [Bacilli bacterium]|nr:hypothetical protein [Bacilli bacterium]
MTEQRMEFMAKAATDSYFANLSPEAKEFVMSDKQAFLSDYMKTFDLALEEAKKMEQSRLQPFGNDDLGKSFK